MTFEFYGLIIEYYVFGISPGHGDSGRGRPESRGNAFEKVNNQPYAYTLPGVQQAVQIHVF